MGPRVRGREADHGDAVRTLLALRDEYQEWLDNLPDSLRESAQADKLAAICELDLEDLESIDPPRGIRARLTYWPPPRQRDRPRRPVRQVGPPRRCADPLPP